MTVDLKSPPPQHPVVAPAPDRRFGRLIIGLVVVLGAAFGLLMLLTVGEEPSDDLTILSQEEVVDTLLRVVETDEMTLEALYSPDWYFDWSARQLPEVEEASFGFFIFETIHEGALTSELPRLTLFTDDGEVVATDVRVVTTTSDHHRVTQVFVPARDDLGRDLLDDESGTMRIELVANSTVGEFEWALPMPNGLGVIEDPTTKSIFGTGTLTMGAIAAIFAGMLTALSPCLLFLATYYSATLSGVAVSDEKATAQAKRKLFTTGAAFVGGFMVIYTIGGVAAGFIGASLSRLDSIDTWARPISMVAGIIVVYMGLRTAAQANVPMVCKIPMINRKPRTGRFGAIVMGSTFAVGCLSCFSATVLSALLLYAGATGSPITGGLIMLIFSTGVGVIFLLAAWLLANAAPLMTWLEKARPYIGAVSAIIMIGFGILMITYKFHIWTGALYKLWS